MSTLLTKRPSNITQLVRIVEKIQRRFGQPLWFRGCGASRFRLVPSLYRHQVIRKAADIAKLEVDLMDRFKHRSLPFNNRSFADDWDQLFYMQHYRIPTRLLDWTENLFIALHFAVMAAKRRVTRNGSERFSTDAALWVLNPARWNKFALRNQRFEGAILMPEHEALKSYRPREYSRNIGSQPIAVSGPHNSSRIVAQRGVFTIFGESRVPMEKLFQDQRFPQWSLLKIVLQQDLLPNFRESVLNLGFTESAVFPDLEGLAREIQRGFGFREDT